MIAAHYSLVEHVRQTLALRAEHQAAIVAIDLELATALAQLQALARVAVPVKATRDKAADAKVRGKRWRAKAALKTCARCPAQFEGKRTQTLCKACYHASRITVRNRYPAAVASR